MKKLEKPLSASEILNRINNQWANKRDIMDIAFVGKNVADNIANTIKTELEAQGYYLPKGVIPMDKLVEYLKININYLKKVSKESNKYEKN